MANPNEISNQEFKENFRKGLLTDLLRAEQALSVVNHLGEIKNKFANKKDVNQARAATYLQIVCLNEKVLALSRIFDKFFDKNVNDRLCVQYFLNKLKNKSVELPENSQIHIFMDYCRNNPFPEHWIYLAQNGERKELLCQIALHFENLFFNHEVIQSIKT